MGHGKLVRNPVTLWTDTSTVLEAELEALDAALTGSVNGDDGGTYAPGEQLRIAGAGMPITGPVVVARGGTLTTTSDISAATTPTITCGDGDWPQIATGNQNATRVRAVSCASARGELEMMWYVRRENGGLQALAPMFDPGDGLGYRVSRAFLPIRPYDRSTLSKVQVYFHVAWPHQNLPTTMPSVRVFRTDRFGIVAPLSSTTAGADENGYVFAAQPASVNAWVKAGQQQSIVVTCDQNNAIDASLYDYFIELTDEQGLTGYPWQLKFTPPVLAATIGFNVTLSGLPTIDGHTLRAGDTLLVKDQTDARQNGIYAVAAGAWARAGTLASSGQFTQGLVVPILNVGNLNNYTMWQAQTSTTSWTPDTTPLQFLTTPDMKLPPEGVGLFGHGLLWQAAQLTCTNIADLRAS